MPPELLWELKPHTKAKHLILKVYLQAWLPIMGSHHGRILLIDGFAGRGRYRGGEEGSPLIILRTLVEHPQFQTNSNREVLVLFIERRAKNAEALRHELTRFCVERRLSPSIK